MFKKSAFERELVGSRGKHRLEESIGIVEVVGKL